MDPDALLWDLIGAVFIGAGVALQFANIFGDRLSKKLDNRLISVLLNSRLFQLFGGLALIALGILAVGQK
jgi:putative Ca2+/H+ antiporter (TMEM165/GDT1 family)